MRAICIVLAILMYRSALRNNKQSVYKFYQRRCLISMQSMVACHAGSQQIDLVCLGTTHFINALVRNKDLAPVAVLRLCGPATRALPPLCDIPTSLCNGSKGYMLPGKSLNMAHIVSQLRI